MTTTPLSPFSADQALCASSLVRSLTHRLTALPAAEASGLAGHLLAPGGLATDIRRLLDAAARHTTTRETKDPRMPLSPASSAQKTTGRPTVLIVAPGDQVYRGYCLEQVAAAYNVVAITPQPLTWETPHVVDHEVADPYQLDQLLAAGEALAARHTLAGVLTWNEPLLVHTARLAEHLGLRTNPGSVMENCRDKHATRRLLAAHRVPSARSGRVANLLQATILAEDIGYPVVLKPAGQAGSVGVIRVDNSEDLARAFDFAAAGAALAGGQNTDVLVEEYLDGPEISVECVTQHGHTHAVAVTRKKLGFAPYFEEIGHTVDAADPLLSQVAPMAAAAIRALGIGHGIQHVEMRLTPSGPRIIEVNGRIGGDLIGHLVRLATGLDLPRIAADLACGTNPRLEHSRLRAAGVTLLYPETSGTLTHRSIDQEFADRTPWLDLVQWIAAVGDEIVLPPEGDVDVARAGLYVVTGYDAAKVEERLAETAQHIALVVQPATGSAGAAA
ncbi:MULTISPECIES: ATP-grasp domain-containing protein [unclassified Streptomyces]|uniref:ATP-grasp domain-containing protein n=1 Tax=unclassified Streptomyces TaxID=2593676 RepID=UPI0029667099|nr:ATP-grasp domain-containing protein [Streptomyces sp. SJL17-1]